ncbi:hypothetical protein BaRGS_00030603 [Batillaria attramentaria]|uniref:Uncharacterized protein n=1 Tax=Batillaria attramentaria TaxID=370345 RepID=A0ABD0JTL1_9CAEN
MPADWSMFGQAVRTNNDVEGWHHALNCAAGRGSLELYQLIVLLHQQACLVTVSVRLLSYHKILRYRRCEYRNSDARLMTLWDDYNSGKVPVSTRQLLKGAAHCVPVYKQNPL